MSDIVKPPMVRIYTSVYPCLLDIRHRSAAKIIFILIYLDIIQTISWKFDVRLSVCKSPLINETNGHFELDFEYRIFEKKYVSNKCICYYINIKGKSGKVKW